MTEQAAASLIYKITTTAEWAAAQASGILAPSPDDARDGFIHLSARHQVAGTAAKYFAQKPDLCLAAFEPSTLGSALRWEVSRGGDLFPHYYGQLAATAAVWCRPLGLGPDGVPRVDEVIDAMTGGTP